MATGNKFENFLYEVYKGTHNFSAHTFKLMLTLSAPVSTNTTTADLTEISAGNGYSSGGIALTVSGYSQTSGVLKIVVDDATMTASGGAIADFRYIVMYNTSASNKLVAYWDYGSTVSMNDGDQFTFDFSGTNGVIQDS